MARAKKKAATDSAEPAPETDTTTAESGGPEFTRGYQHAIETVLTMLDVEQAGELAAHNGQTWLNCLNHIEAKIKEFKAPT